MRAIRLQKIDRQVRGWIWTLERWSEIPRPKKTPVPRKNSAPINRVHWGDASHESKSKSIPIEKKQEPNQATKQVVCLPYKHYQRFGSHWWETMVFGESHRQKLRLELFIYLSAIEFWALDLEKLSKTASRAHWNNIFPICRQHQSTEKQQYTHT